MWQTGVLADIEAAALARGALSVRAVGSVAAGAVDAWSDLDAMVAVPDGGTAEFWPDLDWLPGLGAPADVLGMISAALDCFEQILSHSETQPDFPRPVLDRLIRAATP